LPPLVPLARSVELGALLLHRGCGLSCAALVAWRGVLGYYALRVLLCEAASAPSLCLRWVLARGWEDADVPSRSYTVLRGGTLNTL
jgi:hypothetical protein